MRADIRKAMEGTLQKPTGARAPPGYSLKMASIGTPLEEPALYFAINVAPWLKTATKPQFAGVVFENRYQLDAIKRLARPGMRCVDVGAHVGLFLRAFEKAAPGGAHIAVEPVPWKAATIRAKFPSAAVFQCALGESPGTAEFTERLDRSGASVLSQFDGSRRNARATEKYDVEVRTLDEIALNGPPTGVIKIDVEGAETAVLKGAAGLIERDRPAILFECAPKRNDHASAEIFELLRDRFNYRLTAVRNFVFGDSRITSKSAFDYVRQYPATAFNFVAVPH
jgi:FkbM family methyltransferase